MKRVDWGHVKASEMVRKLGDTGVSVARLLGMMTSSVNWMVRPGEMTERNGRDK